jgi:hypothetical protein
MLAVPKGTSQRKGAETMKKNRVLILGSGLDGLYTALAFEKRRDPRFRGQWIPVH